MKQSKSNNISIDVSDYSRLLKQARKFSKVKAIQENSLRIAVLSSCSSQYFVQVLDFLLDAEGISAEIYEGQYDGIKMDVLDDNSAMYQFKPNIVIILSDYRDIKELPGLFDDNGTVEERISYYATEYLTMWERISNRIPGCIILQNNFVVPMERILGNLESNYTYSRQYFFKELNNYFVKIRPSYVLIVDCEYLACVYGKYNWFDDTAYLMSKLSFSLKYIGIVAQLFCKLISAMKGKIKKCIVLDLDNTLWGGVVSECGWDKVSIGTGTPVGEAYTMFQQYLLGLKNRGVLLAVCSKNDEDIAKEVFINNPNMILTLNDFVAFKANWKDKATNIIDIAAELGIGIDSFVFFDDNPVERELVKTNLPEVEVVDVPKDPAEYVRLLDQTRLFEWLQLTQEDKDRSVSYASNRKRAELQHICVDYEEYLKKLEMTAVCKVVEQNDISRFAQLINKSNQFNLRTIRYSEAEVEKLTNDSNYVLLQTKLTDKFCNYGVISCVILKKMDDECLIDAWVMSCRVLKRDVENYTFKHIYEWAQQNGCNKIIGEYVPTKKNQMVAELYDQLGFELVDCKRNISGSSSKLYEYDINHIPKLRCYIKESANAENRD